MTSQVANICRSAYYHLSRNAKIRNSVSTSACKSLIHGLVTSRIDYGNTILFGISDRHLHRLEIVQRSAVRLVMQIRPDDRQSMTTYCGNYTGCLSESVSNTSYWYSCTGLYTMACQSISSLLLQHAPPSSLRSAGGLLLEVPRENLERFGRRAVQDPLCGTKSLGICTTKGVGHIWGDLVA